MTRVIRYDAGKPFKAARQDGTGWLRVPATVSRVGVLEYRQKDGSIRRELRLPEEVFKADSLATLEQVPVTLEHPGTQSGLLDADTAKAFSVGQVGERVERDGDFIRANLMITDSKAIKEVEKGRREVSAAYMLNLEFTPGTHPIFGRYDAIQRDITYNHVAITKAGRAGREVRLHLDSDAVEVFQEDPVMVKVKINGVEFEVSEQVAQALAADNARRDSEAAATKARADSAEAALETEKKTRVDSATQIKEGVKARLDVERKAAAILGSSVKLDDLSDRDLMVQTVAKAQPAMSDKMKDAEDAYVKAAFDIAVSGHSSTPSQKVLSVAKDAEDLATAETGAAEARKKMIEANRNAWKPKSK